MQMELVELSNYLPTHLECLTSLYFEENNLTIATVTSLIDWSWRASNEVLKCHWKCKVSTEESSVDRSLAQHRLVWRCAYIHGQSNKQRLPLMNQTNASNTSNGNFLEKSSSKASPKLKYNLQPRQKPFYEQRDQKFNKIPPMGHQKNNKVLPKTRVTQVLTRDSQSN